MESFFKNGTIKIGTLYKYREEEKLGNIIGDKNEGKNYTVLAFPQEQKRVIDLSDDSAETHFIKNGIIKTGDTHVIVEMGNTGRMVKETQSINYYLYCFTSKYDYKMMKKFDCNACIEIIDPDLFFQAISKAIRHQGAYIGYHKVAYKNRETDYLNPHKIHPVLQKDVEYSNQYEMRAIWQPKKEPKEELFIEVPEAIKYCREYKG